MTGTTQGEAPVFDAAYYETYYRNYRKQNPPRKLRHYARIIDRHLPSDAPRRIHDVGCGFGLFLGSLDETWEICGSDPSEHAIGRARETVPRGRFAVGTATDGAADTEPAFEGPFGVVTALDVLEHVPKLDRAAEAIRRQLADGGLLLFVVPVYDGPLGPVVHLLDRDPTHVHKWPRRRWLDWAAREFELIDWSGALRYFLPVVKYYVYAPTRRLRRFTPAIAVVCRNVKGERKPQ